MKIRTLIIMTELFCLLVFSLPAEAFNCGVNATGLNFGGYDIFSPLPKDATATITVTCNTPEKKAIPVIISLSPGTSGSFAPRRLQWAGGPDQLDYNLFISPSFSAVWGDGSGNSQTQINTISKATTWNATIYGRIPAQQNVSAGSYSDLITVIVVW